MKVTVVRTGQITGSEISGESDTGSDPVLRGLVDRVDLDTLTGLAAPAAREPFRYEITIAGTTIRTGESRLTPPLRELIHHVLRH